MSEKKIDPLKQERAEAWVGDAVLGLYVREMILREDGELAGEKFSRFTSNDLLSNIGNPTSVEAEIGRVYEDKGLQAGFDHIEAKILPIMLKREKSFLNAERQRGAAKAKTSKRTRWTR